MFYLYITDGQCTGGGRSFNGIIPNGCTECTEEQFNDWQSCIMTNGVVAIDSDKRVALQQGEIIASASEEITQRLAVSTGKIAPLQDAVDLGIATDDETTSLTAWKNYRVLVNRVPTQSGYPTQIEWPLMPE